MATQGAAAVTIDRDYFETLLRRAEFNSDVIDEADPARISVSKAEYDAILGISRQYANLTRNLLQGGIDEDTIALLSADDSTNGPNRDQSTAPPTTATPSQTTEGGARLVPASRVAQSYGNSHGGYQNGHGNYGNTSGRYPPPVQRHESGEWALCSASHDEDSSTEGPEAPRPVPGLHDQHRPEGDRPLLKDAPRSLLLYNLPEGLSHGDITDIVRGGPLLDIYLRNDRSVAVSFVHPQDAKVFFDHVRKHDLYLKNKRVEIKWSDRRFILPGHVANKIRIGATRNLVIRRCGPSHSEQDIRDDLEHIHNLVVIKVEFVGGSCYIKTNSVHNAMFARTCMMSRTKYRKSKIEWDADECAQPIEQVPQKAVVAPRTNGGPKPAARQLSNRFQALCLDGDDE